jgi:hypothetical protein
MTQTHGPKFRLQEQYFKESCSHKYFPQVTFPPLPSFLTTQYIFEVTVYQSPIYSVSL